MNKTSVLLIACMAATVASADITSYLWDATGQTTDGVSAGDYVLSVLDDDATIDMFAFVTAGQIDIADLGAFSAWNSSDSIINLAFQGGGWKTDTINSADDSAAGKFVWAIVSDSATIGGIAVGETFLLTEVAGPILAGTVPAGLPSTFAPGTVSTITVVPEPATVGLFGLGALSAWIIRRNKQKAREEV